MIKYGATCAIAFFLGRCCDDTFLSENNLQWPFEFQGGPIS